MMGNAYPFVLRAAIVLSGVLALSGCDSSPSAPSRSDALFEVSACSNQTFVIRLTDAQLVRRAEGLVGQAQQPIVNGRIARGNGGFNEPYSWHMVPESLQFADVTAEVCDGCPQMVERDLEYWIDTVGRFCPWTSRIVRRIR